MLRTRVIPCLLLKDQSLVKTIKFDKYGYIGDPINTVRIFNELEVDELIFLDITATSEKRAPNFKILSEIANECFMPLSYGGGLKNIDDIKKVFNIGLEKVVINSYAYEDIDFVSRVADIFGSQSIIVSIDARKNFWGKYETYKSSGKLKTHKSPVEWAVEMEKKGAGELMITSIDYEGTWKGYDLALLKSVTDAVNIPVIAHGGACSLDDFKKAVNVANASAVAAGSMFVYQANGLGVLVNFPSEVELKEYIN